MAAAPPYDDGVHSAESRARPIKKLFIILTSFVLAIALLAVTNVVLAHVFVAKAVLFPSPSTPQPETKAEVTLASSSSSSSSPKPKEKKKKKKRRSPPQKPEPVVVTKTVYVAPTKEDLDRIRQELETSDPLPPIELSEDDDSQRSAARIQSVISSTEALLSQRDEELDVAKKEMNDLVEAFDSLTQRLEQDTTGSGKGVPMNDVTVQQLKEHMPSLTSILGRSSFMDLNRQEVVQLFTLALEDLDWLLSAEHASPDAEKATLFLNANNILLDALLINGKTENVNGTTESTCQTSYLALDQGKPSEEFTPPPPNRIIKKKRKAKKSPVKPKMAVPPITEETARESDLYELVEIVKNILSRRDLSSAKMEDNGEPMHSPINEEGVDAIRSQISPVVATIQKKWISVLNQEVQMREYWTGRTEALAASAGNVNDPSDSEGRLCASPHLVEGLVTGGLETLRRKGDLRSSLASTTSLSLGEQDPDKILALEEEMGKVVMPEIDYERDGRGGESPRGTSSWKVGRRSVYYAVDSPLLHQGVVGWIDSFVEVISGYNDNVDALLDWAVGDEGGTVGTSVVDGFSKLVRKIPFPKEEHVERLKKTGILAGRTRVLLEE